MIEVQGRSSEPAAKASLGAGFKRPCITSNDDLIAVHKLDKVPGFFRWLSTLVRGKTSWSPVLIAGEFWRFFANIGMLPEILNLFKLRPFAEITRNRPGFAFKYLVPNYLVRGFTGTECVSCFLHDYMRMHEALPEGILRQILQEYVTLHEIAEGGNRFAFTLGSLGPGDKEGELSLALRVDATQVFCLSFTIVPGWVVKSEAGEILLITGLQGMTGCRHQLKLVRKYLHEYSPRKLLLGALQGIADVFGISELHAVCATNQKSYSEQLSSALKSCYDDFFTQLGMVRTSAGFYFSSIPIKDRPIASFQVRYRSQARKRRAMRQQVRSICATFLQGEASRAAPLLPLS